MEGMDRMVPFALVMLGAAAAALLLMLLTRKKYGLTPGSVFVFGAFAAVLCVLAGRAAFWLCSLDWIPDSGLSFWDLLGEHYNYMLYGALAGGLAAALFTRLITRKPFGNIVDAAAAPAALLIAAGRFAEYLIGAGFGSDVVEWFDPFEEWSMIAWENPDAVCRFPFAVENYYGSWRFAINLWEGLAAVVFFVVLLRLARRRSGGAATLLILMYACCQVLFESMRRDEVIIWGFVKANQLISAILILGIMVFCWLKTAERRKNVGRLIIHVAVMLVLAGVVMLMEFALDQKVSFLMWMRADLSYIVMALCCAGMLLNALPLWRRAWPKQEA